MSEQDISGAGSRPDADTDEERIEQLISQAGRRPEIPAEYLATIKTAFRAEWQDHVGQAHHQPRATWRALAIAASVLVALGLGALWSLRSLNPVVVAHVDTLDGVVLMSQSQESDPEALESGQRISDGTYIDTSANPSDPGHIALRLTGGASLRIAKNSRVQLMSAGIVELERGTLYIDTGVEQQRTGTIEVRTAFGVVADIGTQFEVALLDVGEPSMRVRVREGAILVEGGESPHRADAGEELTLYTDGRGTTQPIARHGAAWDWILAVGPPLDTQDPSLRELLTWVGRETGWEIRYQTEDLEDSAGQTKVYLPSRYILPDEVLDLLPGAQISYQLADGILVIRPTGDAVP